MVSLRRGETRESYLQRAREKQRKYTATSERINGSGREAYLQKSRDYNKRRFAALTDEEKAERARKIQEQVILKFWGLTPEDRQLLLNSQDGGCAICGKLDERSRHGRLHVDHCHKTGRIRGLLCNRCNRGIGWLLDSVDLLEKATQYLRRAEDGHS